ncbi:precorrin-2 dehydrogenase/sirohydrochlorin ferrochelatase family protein [Halocatena pleomorpha]|uniref:precorrin-2 dehydrogenase n=1 Tax=Halocatena pleomorpha TaxID=1785090 RepID=A0A3P3R2R1_9EURY|nr:bifunctional precorrin-2 dehydrogenase/sirohydrochlorin ferrochelatase [Halocatena pleomorpha]RRJ27766.1 bifunctional precorrin-2 dehydrogenase/sirohydrochlorin ferrochelatase [Halocatena pleomorpha]
MIPILHDFTGTRVLVFGGGRVGARRARTFAREADVVVVSPTFVAASFGSAARVRAAPEPAAVAGWIDRVDPALVVAATDRTALNEAIATAGHERGILVNRADQAAGADRTVADVAVPATVWSDPVVVGVSTGGHSPALTRVLRERIEPHIEDAGEMARVTGDLRATLDDVPPTQRRSALRAVVRSDRVWKALGDSQTKTEQAVSEVIASELGETE